jgi:hypothetical protein
MGFNRSSSASSQFDDDMALAGEYIDDPDDDVGPVMASRSEMFGSISQEVPGVYGPNDRMSSHGHRSRHSFTSTSQLEQMPTTGMGRNYNHVDNHYHHASTLSGPSVPRTVYNIKFKKTQRNFVAGPRLNRDLDIGCYVKVEADRGEDLGIVIGKMSAEKFNASAGRASFRTAGQSPRDDMGMGAPGVSPSSASDLKRVIRLATHDEVNLLAVKREEEEELLNICRTKVRQRSLPMHVVDAEYQFDRHKLTFFFEAEGRVDFRELVRDLFSMYKTRIWMQQLDKNSSSSSASDALPEYGRSYATNPLNDNERTESFN